MQASAGQKGGINANSWPLSGLIEVLLLSSCSKHQCSETELTLCLSIWQDGRTDSPEGCSATSPRSGVPAPGCTDPDPHPHTALGVLRGEAHSSRSHSRTIFCLQIRVGGRGRSWARRDRQTPARPAPGQRCRACQPPDPCRTASPFLLSSPFLLPFPI